MKLSNEDHLRIASAVAAAERTTSGEIRCVLAEGDPLALDYTQLGTLLRRFKMVAAAVRGGSPSALKVLPLAAFMASDKPTTPPTLVAPLAREEIDLLPNAQ